jgi:hypothetical protein
MKKARYSLKQATVYQELKTDRLIKIRFLGRRDPALELSFRKGQQGKPNELHGAIGSLDIPTQSVWAH